MSETLRESSAELQENIEEVPGTKKWGNKEPLREDLIPKVPEGSEAGVERPGDLTGDESASLGSVARERSLSNDEDDVPEQGGHSV